MHEMAMMIRQQFGEGDEIRDAGLTTPTGIERFDDIAYGPDPDWQMLDVYRPKDAQLPLPVIVSIHGGAWVYGDKERYQWYCMDLALRGFVVVNFTYRLAPEFQFPASIEDTCSVFQWTIDHIAEYGGDPNKVFVVGDSAGGSMLGIFSCMCTNPAYAAKYGCKAPEGFVPTAIAINCGACRVVISDDEADMTSGLMDAYLPEGGSDAELDLINWETYVTPEFPPAFIMTADGDFLHDDAEPLSKLLRKLKVCHELHIYGGVDEPLGHVFHCNMKSEDARRCNDDECRFFKRFV
ncbi:MAG: alpha/beta hydrolase, partial [Atopobiaceae bacterium]|nr:alpha/beta hydrolase [Atopobiaceae bacterium]